MSSSLPAEAPSAPLTASSGSSEASMTERVARALCALAYEDHGNDYKDPPAVIDRRWPQFVPQARAAIEAMREPTTAMDTAGYAVQSRDGGEWIDPDDTWKAMIDAAMKD